MKTLTHILLLLALTSCLAPQAPANKKSKSGASGDSTDITVDAPTGSSSTINFVDLSWGRPNYRVSGASLTNLAGYRIYRGTSSGNYNRVLNVGANVTSYRVDSLEPGTYFFSIKAVDQDGVESAFAPEQVATIQ